MSETETDPTVTQQSVTYINTPASFGVEVNQTYSDGHTHRHQLANPRDTMTLLFGIAGANSKWVTWPVTSPERFMDKPPDNQREWKLVVDKWLAGGAA